MPTLQRQNSCLLKFEVWILEFSTPQVSPSKKSQMITKSHKRSHRRRRARRLGHTNFLSFKLDASPEFEVWILGFLPPGEPPKKSQMISNRQNVAVGYQLSSVIYQRCSGGG